MPQRRISVAGASVRIDLTGRRKTFPLITRTRYLDISVRDLFSHRPITRGGPVGGLLKHHLHEIRKDFVNGNLEKQRRQKRQQYHHDQGDQILSIDRERLHLIDVGNNLIEIGSGREMRYVQRSLIDIATVIEPSPNWWPTAPASPP